VGIFGVGCLSLVRLPSVSGSGALAGPERRLCGQTGERIHLKLAPGESLAEREDRYRCPECGREVETKRGLSNHLAKVHRDRWEHLPEDGLVVTLVGGG